jgi:hypothetical protein
MESSIAEWNYWLGSLVIQPQRALACRMTVSVSESKAGTLGDVKAGGETALRWRVRQNGQWALS